MHHHKPSYLENISFISKSTLSEIYAHAYLNMSADKIEYNVLLTSYNISKSINIREG